MQLTVKIDARKVQDRLKALAKAAGEDGLDRALLRTAELVLAKARRRAPVGYSGHLRDSEFSEVLVERNGVAAVRIGFNTPYASVMDLGWKKRIIRPVRAKALFIPLSGRAVRLGPARAKELQALTRLHLGDRNAKNRKDRGDFLFAQSVKTRRAQHGSTKGPNYFFSDTLKEESKAGKILESFAANVDAILQRAGKQ